MTKDRTESESKLRTNRNKNDKNEEVPSPPDREEPLGDWVHNRSRLLEVCLGEVGSDAVNIRPFRAGIRHMGSLGRSDSVGHCEAFLEV